MSQNRVEKRQKNYTPRRLDIVPVCCSARYWELQTGLEGGRNKRKLPDTVNQLILQSSLAENRHIQ